MIRPFYDVIVKCAFHWFRPMDRSKHGNKQTCTPSLFKLPILLFDKIEFFRSILTISTWYLAPNSGTVTNSVINSFINFRCTVFLCALERIQVFDLYLSA